jgi:hypothetical protein
MTVNVGSYGFNFFKTKQSLKNHDICYDEMISYVEAVVQNWEGFRHFVTYDV